MTGRYEKQPERFLEGASALFGRSHTTDDVNVDINMIICQQN